MTGSTLTLLWLTLSYLLLTLSLVQELHPGIYLCALLILIWRYRITWWQAKAPPPWLLNGLALAGLAALYFLWQQQGFLPAMLNLLVLGCTLKFMEFGSRRHLSWHAISLFFLCALTFIYQQSLAFTLLMSLVVLLNTLGLLSIYQQTGWQAQARQVGRLLLLSLPLMWCLFVLLPHLGPMWRLPDVKKATTGLSDSLAPGEVAELSRSSALAFRARFADTVPPVSRLYWRALVLEAFDGGRWSIASSQAEWVRQQTQGYRPAVWPLTGEWGGPTADYSLIVEPTQQHWLYSLDYSQPDEKDVLLTPTGTLISRPALQQKRQIRLRHYPQANPQLTLSAWQRKVDLQLPSGINPQTNQRVAELRMAHPDETELVQAMLSFFAEQGLVYTLYPPVLNGPNQIDDLLFGSRRGFCAHFAGALVYMLRQAGIPARMVTGYLGGELSADGEFISVYQFNAHAWVEAWWQGRWQRLDPTLMVAPDRAESNLDQLLPADETRLRDPFSLASYSQTRAVAWLHQWLSELDYRWSVWVLNYDNRRQEQWLSGWFGNSLLARGCLMLGGLLVTLGLVWILHSRRQTRPVRDPLLQAYRLACARIEREYGRRREPHETPQQYLQRLTDLPAPVQQRMMAITDWLVAARYRQQDGAEARRQIRQLLRHWPRHRS